MTMIRGKLRTASRLRLLWLAATMAAGGMGWAMILPAEAGPQRSLNGARQALRNSGRPPAARVLAASGPAQVVGSGRPRPVAAGSDLEGGEVVVTGEHSMLLIETADGGRYEVFPESRVRFRASDWTWLERLELNLKRIKARIQGLGGLAAPHRLTSPTAVLAVRAAVLPAAGSDVRRPGTSWVETRNRR